MKQIKGENIRAMVALASDIERVARQLREVAHRAQLPEPQLLADAAIVEAGTFLEGPGRDFMRRWTPANGNREDALVEFLAVLEDARDALWLEHGEPPADTVPHAAHPDHFMFRPARAHEPA